MPVSMRESSHEAMEELFKPYNKDEQDLDQAILLEKIDTAKYHLSKAKKDNEKPEVIAIIEQNLQNLEAQLPMDIVRELAKIEAKTVNVLV